MGIARKTYAFRGEMVGAQLSSWEFKLRSVIGSNGRPEPYDPLDTARLSKAKPWTFQTSGTRAFGVDKITIDGTTVYTSGQRDSDIVKQREDGINRGFYKVEFDTANFLISRNSVVILFIRQSGVYTPWIPSNKDTGYAGRGVGLVDMDGVIPEGAASIKISQDIDMASSGYTIGTPIFPSLTGVLVGVSTNAYVIASLYGDYTGIGTVTLTYNDNAMGSSTAKLINDSIVFDPVASKNLSSVPFAQFRYKLKIAPNIVMPDLLTGLNLVTTGGFVIETTEYFCLKYQDTDINGLTEFCCFAFMPYVDALSPLEVEGDSPSQEQRTDSQDKEIEVPTNYRHEIEGADVFWFDRIRQISYLKHQQGPASFPYPAPKEFEEGVYTEFNELNNKMRLNRPIRTELTLKSFVGAPAIVTSPASTYGFGMYEVDMSMRSSPPASLSQKYNATNFSFADKWNAVKLYVYIEDNACVDTSEPISLGQKIVVMGKLINFAWFKNHKGIMTNESIIHEKFISEWTGISKSTFDFLLENFEDSETHDDWIIVVRGLGDVHAPEELIAKDVFYDCAITNILPREIFPGGEAIVSDNGIPVFNLDFIQKTKSGLANPHHIVIEYKDTKDEWRELSRDILFPGREDFSYNHNKEFVAPCVLKDGTTNEFLFNYPVFGTATEMFLGIANAPTPKLYIPVDTSKQSSNGLPFSSPTYTIYVLQDGVRIVYGEWKEVIEGGNLVGIIVREPSERSFYQLSLLNFNAEEVTNNQFPSTTKKAKAIRVRELPGIYNMLINNFASGDVLSLEPVGCVRRTDQERNDIYYELVPGKGLKARSAGAFGHGVSFAPYDFGTSAALSGRIQGLVDYPWFYVDPYREKRYEPVSGDNNGIEKLVNGSEILAKTSLYFGASSARGLLFYTLLEKFQPPRLKDVIISAQYDDIRHEGFMTYTNTDGRFAYVQGLNEFRNKWEFRRDSNYSQIPNKKPDSEINMTKKDVFALGSDSIEKTQRIVRSKQGTQVMARPITIEDEDEYPSMTGMFETSPDYRFLESISINFMGIVQDATISPVSDWSNTACFVVEYSTRGDSELKVVGWTDSRDQTNANFYSTRLATVINIPLGLIEDAEKVIVRIVEPPFVSVKELSDYNTFIKNVKFLSIMYGNFQHEEDMQEGTAGSLWRDSEGKTNFIFDSGRLYGDNGRILEKNPQAPVLSQMVTSRNNGEFWLYPGLEYGDTVTRGQEVVDLEKSLLGQYGILPEDAAKIALKKISYNIPKVVTTFEMPNTVSDKVAGATYVFGYKANGNDVSVGDLVCWRLEDSIIGRSDFSFQRLEDAAVHAGGLDVPSSTVATVIPKQTPSPTIANDGTLVVLWHDANGEINVAISNNQGAIWDRSPIRIGRIGSKHGKSTSARACISPDSNTIHVFSLVATGDQATLEEIQAVGQYQLCVISIPMEFFKSNNEKQIAKYQEGIDKIPRTLVTGAINNKISEEEKAGDLSFGNYDSRLNKYNAIHHIASGGTESYPEPDKDLDLVHFVGSYFDRVGKFRVFYMNEERRLTCKISTDYGKTWRLDKYF